MAAVCAQFAYYSLLALAPLLILIIFAVAHLPLDGLLESFQAAVAGSMPDEAVKIIENQVRDIQLRSTFGLLLVSLVVLGFAGSRIFWTMGTALDLAFDSVGHRRAWIRGSVSLALTFGVFGLLLTAMVLLVVSPLVVDSLTQDVTSTWLMETSYFLIKWGVACGFMLMAASIIYWVVPSADVPWHWFSPGSVYATVGWVIVMWGFRVFVENFGRYNETYGALAGVIVLMTWLYLTGAVLLMGGQINGVIYRAEMLSRKTDDQHPESEYKEPTSQG